MKKETLFSLFKYYHGEKEPPEEYNRVQALWWEGERQLAQKITDNPEYFETILNAYRDAMKEKSLSGILADRSLDERKRAIIFYLDLWHGRYYPYDSLDLIFEY